MAMKTWSEVAVGAALGGIGYYLYSSTHAGSEAHTAQTSEKQKEQALPFTERANEITDEIDTADAEGIIRILRQTDAQVYEGWREHSGLLDPACITAIERVAEAVRRVVLHHAKGGKGKVICAGCGTSGRVAFQVTKPGGTPSRCLLLTQTAALGVPRVPALHPRPRTLLRIPPERRRRGPGGLGRVA